ncbi:MAG TPA: hypothetical protein VHC21_01245 [Candidatus Saccharimonadales bacterium]|nr:hypothetical protein [Candidatus Saccharimonadales bacterium]
MTEMLPHEAISSATIEAGAPEAPERPAGYKFRQLARTALAVAGVSLALAGSSEAVVPAAAAAAKVKEPADTTSTLGPVATAPLAPVPEPYAPRVGIATGSWNDDGLGNHTLFKNMASEGLSEVRLSYLGNDSAAMREMRDEIASALANGIQPVLGLPVNLAPRQAAAVVDQFPNVNAFVIGNEVNSPLFSNLTPQQYVDLLAHTSAAIRGVRPGVDIRAFALASNYHPIAYLEAASQYAEQAYGGLQNIATTIDEHDYGSLTRDEQKLQTTIQIIGPTMPIVLGEVGFILDDATHTGYNTPAEQAQDEIDLYTDLQQYPEVKSMDIFRYEANPTDPFDTANVAQNGTPRPAYYALQTILLNR